MKPQDPPIRMIAILEDEGAPRSDRVTAAKAIAIWARVQSMEVSGHQDLFDRVVKFWRSLSEPDQDPSWPLLIDRTRAASACTLFGMADPGGQRFFMNSPKVTDAVGPDPRGARPGESCTLVARIESPDSPVR